jgi:16S rRNA (uracil1498-N3)-methyltransferase
MHIFFLPAATEGPVILSEEESKHAIRVLRMQAGDNAKVTNGKGNFFPATMIDAHPKRAILNLFAPTKGYDHWPFHLHLAVAPTKNSDRIEWFVEKATEIGVDEISFFSSFHSERRSINLERMEKICVAALKQSQKSRLPQINELCSFDAFIDRPINGQKFIAWIDSSANKTLQESYRRNSNCVILIGPEGDFSAQEVEKARAAGYSPVSLGQARLRTETAALISVHTIQLINQQVL